MEEIVTDLKTWAKSIKHNNRLYYKGLATKDFIFYVRYDDDDVVMFNIKTRELISDNYFAVNELFTIVSDRTYIWTSRTMLENIKLAHLEDSK